MRWIVPALALGGLSLLGHRSLAFDAEAWVVWGREALSLSIDTSAGPSWKPLPVLFTAPFALLGDAAPWLWLAVVRAAALLAVAGVAILASRVAGPAAGAVAAVLVVLSPWWGYNAALGNSEPVLVACLAWAAVAHGDGRPRLALALGAAGALVRPEVWPFLGFYGLRLARRGEASWPLVLGTGAAVLALWIVPDLLASGLRSTRGAVGSPSEGVAGLAAFPFGAVWEDAALALTAPVLLAAALAARRPAVRPWLAAAVAYVLLVAVMAQAGFSGNVRYVIPALAAVCAAAACAVADVPGRLRRGLAAAALPLAALAFTQDDLRRQRADLAERDRIRARLDALVDRAGGPAALRACGPVRTGPGQRAVVARAVREPIPVADGRPRPGDPVLTLRPDGTWVLDGCPMPR